MLDSIQVFTMFEPQMLVCAMLVFPVFGAETCDVEIAQHCCRKKPL